MIVEVDISSDAIVDAIASGDIVLAQALAPRLFETDADAFAADLALSRLRRAA